MSAKTANTIPLPRLESARLELSPIDSGDRTFLCELLADPRINEWSNYREMRTDRQLARALFGLEHAYAIGSGCAWTIRLHNSPAAIGFVRLAGLSSCLRSAEISYELSPQYWGTGLMTEAVAAVVRCGQDFLCLDRMEAWIDSDNFRAERILRKTGFTFEGTQRRKTRSVGTHFERRLFARNLDRESA